jgi:hypothetical protein
MGRKSGFQGGGMREHDPEKWEPVSDKIMLKHELDRDPMQLHRVMV